MTRTTPTDSLLRRALRINAGFSLVSGLALLLAGGPLYEFSGIEPILLRLVGAGLLPWAVIVNRIASRTDLRKSQVQTVIAGDLAWVAGTIVVAIAASSAFTTAGLITFVVVAVIVADFAAAQLIGMRRARWVVD